MRGLTGGSLLRCSSWIQCLNHGRLPAVAGKEPRFQKLVESGK
jgi:hypothetical protein